jgi:hypothetical protein
MGFRNRLNFPPGSITAAMLADGSVTGPKLSFDAIDGKTITGAKIRTAAPPAMRWELTSDAVNLLRAYSGDATYPDPGGVEVGTGGSPGSVQLLAPAPSGITPAHLILRQIDAGGSSEVVLSSKTGGGTLEDTANAANNIQWFNGNLTVPGQVVSSGSIISVAYAGTTDASGFLTVTHGAGFTPAAGWAFTTNPNASFASPWGIDTITATTVRLRFANVAGTGAAATTAVAGRLFLVHP